jgi:acetoin utilization protein AcuC
MDIMTCTLHVAWDERLAGYDFGPGHPMAPIRLKLTMELARAFGLFHLDRVSVEVPPPATRAELELYHSPGYIDVVRLAGSGRLLGPGQQDMTERVLLMHGLGTEDDPVFPGMHEAAAMVTGATLAAARAVWTSAAQHGASIAGGLHHAMAGNASGFCVYNDPAIAITWMLAQGAERIAYVDVDVHHGDGVQAAFYDDPRVLTISLHEHPATLFPGTGLASEIGSGQGRGYAVNVALPAFTGDAGWLRAFDAVVPPLLRAFKPEVLVSQHGCDSHRLDPLANLELSVDGQRRAQLMVHDLAHEVAGGKWLLTGGGGYQLVQVVPRSWTHLLAVASGEPIDPAALVPEAWRALAAGRTGEGAPTRMTDGTPAEFIPVGAGIDPADRVDAAIINTCRAVFAWHGLTSPM